jgi:DivIVA domain-containing protein
MPLTPADVRNKQFSTTRLRPGYDEEGAGPADPGERRAPVEAG